MKYASKNTMGHPNFKNFNCKALVFIGFLLALMYTKQEGYSYC